MVQNDPSGLTDSCTCGRTFQTALDPGLGVLCEHTPGRWLWNIEVLRRARIGVHIGFKIGPRIYLAGASCQTPANSHTHFMASERCFSRDTRAVLVSTRWRLLVAVEYSRDSDQFANSKPRLINPRRGRHVPVDIPYSRGCKTYIMMCMESRRGVALRLDIVLARALS